MMIGLYIIAEGNGGVRAMLRVENINADWISLDLKDVAAMTQFMPTNVQEVYIESDRGILRSLVEQKYAQITLLQAIPASKAGGKVSDSAAGPD